MGRGGVGIEVRDGVIESVPKAVIWAFFEKPFLIQHWSHTWATTVSPISVLYSR